MGLKDLIFGKSYVCDICDGKIQNISDGYILNTTEVLSSGSYWRFYFKKVHPEIQREDRQGKIVPLYVKELASAEGQSHGWLVCNSCSSLFDFDKRLSQGSGVGSKKFPPADFKKTLIIAAIAWNSVYGYPIQSFKDLYKDLEISAGSVDIQTMSSSSLISLAKQFEKEENFENALECYIKAERLCPTDIFVRRKRESLEKQLKK
jgi:hypothetical protein